MSRPGKSGGAKGSLEVAASAVATASSSDGFGVNSPPRSEAQLLVESPSDHADPLALSVPESEGGSLPLHELGKLAETVSPSELHVANSGGSALPSVRVVEELAPGSSGHGFDSSELGDPASDDDDSIFSALIKHVGRDDCG